MNTLLEQELITRIKNGLCFICGGEIKEKVNINHPKFGDVNICLKHMGDKIE